MIFKVEVHFDNCSHLDYFTEFEDLETAYDWLSDQCNSFIVEETPEKVFLFNMQKVTGIVITPKPEVEILEL